MDNRPFLTKAHAVLFGCDKHKSFGVGDPKREEECENFQVYITCKGYLGNDKRHVQVGKGSSIGDARAAFGRLLAAFGRPMRQQDVTDEDGYKICAKDQISQHSCDCRVSLILEYDRAEEIHRLGTLSQSQVESFQACRLLRATKDEEEEDEEVKGKK